MSIKHTLVVTMTEEKRKELEQLVKDLKVCSNTDLPCRLCSHKDIDRRCNNQLIRDAAKAIESLLGEK